MPDLIIRPESAGDHPAIRALTIEVFTEAFGSGEAEATLVEKLRGQEDFDPNLSLVATIEERVVGHIFFCTVRFQHHPEVRAAALAPMSVHRNFQKRGVSSKLARQGLSNCTRRGYVAMFTQGDPGYYSRFGFELLGPKGITTPFRSKYDLALELVPGALGGVRGPLLYPDAYDPFLEKANSHQNTKKSL